jgi:hypothetical protein
VKNKKQPSRRQATVLRQLVELIPSYLVPKLARVHGVDRQSRTFSPWSHVVALLYAQMAHALSLNDVCDGLRLWATPLRALRGASAPSRNNLSHANKTRDCAMAEDLFWQVLGHLQSTFPGFGRGRTKGLAWRFHRTIHVVDATVIQLVASCLDWAKHRRRKAAAKCHMRLSLRSMLPGFVVIDAAREHDIRRARQLSTQNFVRARSKRGTAPWSTNRQPRSSKYRGIRSLLDELDASGVGFVIRNPLLYEA